jgi:RimJ/RimL family protein N-acetyltransferase
MTPVVVQPWVVGRPPGTVAAGHAVLTRVAPVDREPLVAAVNSSLDHLRPWMPWAQEPASAESIDAFLEAGAASWEAGTGFSYTVRRAPGGPIVGCCGLHDRIGPGVLEIGYWIHVEHVRNGLASVSAGALTDAALALPEVRRVEIHCDEANVASAAVPRRLGYVLDRIEPRPRAAPAETGRMMIWATQRARGA